MVNVLNEVPVTQVRTLPLYRMFIYSPLYLLGTKAQTILFNEPGDIAVRQTEDKAEAQRRAFPSDQSETVFPEIFPERVFRKLRVCVKKIFLYISVNAECVECYNLAFDKTERIEGVLQKQMGCKILYPGHSQCCHSIFPPRFKNTGGCSRSAGSDIFIITQKCRVVQMNYGRDLKFLRH